jgi:hypothetical protein
VVRVGGVDFVALISTEQGDKSFDKQFECGNLTAKKFENRRDVCVVFDREFDAKVDWVCRIEDPPDEKKVCPAPT